MPFGKGASLWHIKLSGPRLPYEPMRLRLPISNKVRIFAVPDLCSKGVKAMLMKVAVLKVGFRWRVQVCENTY